MTAAATRCSAGARHRRPRTCSRSCRRRASAAAAAPASRWARCVRSSPRATWTILVCNAESPSRHVQGPRADCRGTRICYRGICIAAHAVGANRRSSSSRRVRPPGRRPRGGARGEAQAANVIGGLDLVSPTAAPARHLRLGDGAARTRSRQARQPPPEAAAVPWPCRASTAADADQHVETLMNAPLILRMGGEEYARSARSARPARRSSRLGLRAVPGNYEIDSDPVAQSVYLAAAARGPLDQVSVPGGPRARRCSVPTSTSTCRTTSNSMRRPARCSAPARSSSRRRLGAGGRRRAERPTSTANESCGKCTPCARAPLDREDARAVASGDATPMDLDIIASSWSRSSATAFACSATRWRCGRLDDQALPREFEAHIEARESATGRLRPAQVNRRRARRADAVCVMPRPAINLIPFTIDGR